MDFWFSESQSTCHRDRMTERPRRADSNLSWRACQAVETDLLPSRPVAVTLTVPVRQVAAATPTVTFDGVSSIMVENLG